MRNNYEQTAGIKKLVKRNFKTQKRKNTVLFFIILFITCCYTCFFFLKYNEFKNLERYAQHVNGTLGQVVFQGLSGKEAGGLRDSFAYTWMGESIFLSDAKNQELGNQQTQIRYADETYADAFYAKPTVGTMPVGADEAAVGIKTLKKLGIPLELNEVFSIWWMNEGDLQKTDFKLVGYWEEDPEVNSNFIWVSELFAREENSDIDIVAAFEDPKGAKDRAKLLAESLGIEQEKYTVMLINRKSILQGIVLNLNSFIVPFIIFLTGTLAVNSIQQISIAGSLTFYGRLKAMGAEEKQIRHVIWYEALLITVMAIPFGLLFGCLAGAIVTPEFVNGSLGYTSVYFDCNILILPFLLALLTVGAANVKPALQAGKTDIDKAFKYKGCMEDGRKRDKKYPGISILLQMSLDNISRYKKRSIVGVCILVLGLVWISSFYIIHISFDQNKYFEAMSFSDFSVNSGDLSLDTIGSSELWEYAQNIQNREGITGIGSLYLKREYASVPDTVFYNIEAYYENSQEKRLAYMQYDTLWVEQYEKMKETRSCKYQIWGIDGILVDEILRPEYLIKGNFDEEKFRSGKYVIAQGISGDQGVEETQPTFCPGDSITIGGDEFEVMAVAEIPNSVRENINSAVSGFELSFYMAADRFQEIYPVYPQKIFVNTSPYIKEKMELELEELEKEKGFSFVSEQRLINQYQKDIIHQNGMEILIGAALLGIGLIQMIHSIASSIITRRKEFVLMNHIGMTRRQIRCMLMLEAMDCMFVTLVFAYVISLSCITTVIKSLVNSQWASSFSFSIIPLLMLTPVLLLLSAAVPAVIYRFQVTDE